MTRHRGPDWSTAQTTKLAELKRSSNEAGSDMWDSIAATISAQFSQQPKTATQCRQRWDTLVKGYRKLEEYCLERSRSTHTELSEEEIQSLHLSPAYDRGLYSIIQEVCGRNVHTASSSRTIQHTALTSGKSSIKAGTNPVPSAVTRVSPSHTLHCGAANIPGAMGTNRSEAIGAFDTPAWNSSDANSLSTYHSMSITISTASGISEEPQNLTDEEWADSMIVTPPESDQVETDIVPRESPSHNPWYGTGGLDIYQFEAFDVPPLSATEENALMLHLSRSNTNMSMASGTIVSLTTEQETEQVSSPTVPAFVDRSSASHDPRFGAPGIPGFNQPQNDFSRFGLPEWRTDDANFMSHMFQLSRASSISTVMNAEECFQSSEFIHKTDSDSGLQSDSRSQDSRASDL